MTNIVQLPTGSIPEHMVADFCQSICAIRTEDINVIATFMRRQPAELQVKFVSNCAAILSRIPSSTDCGSAQDSRE